ncbi:MAG TPA: endo-1,4-beta-xylanase [Luteibacter sp.]|uniref:endo-1,4-beta-xylanase n=1 Tax=Luteibacter sp. TaxID=1886636 RepID=UPI002F42802D
MRAPMKLSRRDFLRGLAGAAAFAPSTLIAAPEADIPLHRLAAAKGICFGSEIGLGNIDDPHVVHLIQNECAMVVPENEFKMYAILPDQGGAPDFSNGDRIVAFARDHGKLLRGHNLIWMKDEVAQPWLLNYDFGPRPRIAAEAFIRNYIHEVTQHFGPAVTSWDVINEAIDVGTGELRNCVFTRILGRDAVRIAFEAAHESMPKAQLFYNDYMDWRADREPHRQGVLRLLRWLQDRHVPVHALGVQSHIKTAQTPFDPDRWGVFLNDVAAMGFSMAITEFDVNDQMVPGTVKERDRQVADIARLYLDQMLSFKEVKSFLLWGICDKYSYLRDVRKRADGRPVRPNPYDDRYHQKPLRETIALALKHAPVRTADRPPL